MRASDIWFGAGMAPAAVRTALTPLSWIYALGWEAYEALYSTGLKRPKETHRPVVCVGNLTVGGSGKTPLTVHLAEVLAEWERSVVISVSGYGAPRSQGASLAPDGPLSPAEWGDEPALLRSQLPDVPLIVGRNRVRAAELCHEHFPDSVLLLDDGFQHLPLKKHVSIVLDEPAITNRRCLPAGPYREPRNGLKRADLVIPNGFRLESRFEGLEAAEPAGSAPAPSGRVGALCAIARPERFFLSLEANGFRPEHRLALPDHDPLTEGNLFERFPAGLPLVVTAKDWVKLRERPDAQGRPIWIARHRVAVEPQDAFRQWLQERLAHPGS